jgi:diadenosine tetraphosphate (Ap4A) HIT family hydrolase
MDKCPFCNRPDTMLDSKHVYLMKDQNQDFLGRSLVNLKRHVESFFDIEEEEFISVIKMLYEAEKVLKMEYPDIEEIGVHSNWGSAGQTIKHAHFHVMPYRAAEDYPHMNAPVREHVWENEYAYAGYHPYPEAYQHVEIMPKRFIVLNDLSLKEIWAMFQLMKDIKNDFKVKHPEITGYRLYFNSQGTFHLLPFRDKDDNTYPWLK